MRASTERILVTHVGSMPRPREVVDLLARREAGEPYDRAAFDAAMTGAVSEIVRKQLSAGVDVVSDGEQSKPSYATYVKDRLTGFSGDSPGMRGADLDDFPGFFRRLMSRRAGAIRLARPCCTGPIAVKDRAPLEADLARLRAALVENGAAEGFMNAASPGVIAVFQPNRHYATQAGYLEALAEAMRDEYRAIVDAGLLLQVDCPDLAMGRHVTYKGEGDDDFVRHAAEQVEALNQALEGIPADRVRLHLCWGNYEGPHHRDIPLGKIFGVVMKAKAGALLFEAANPRHAHEWAVFAARKREIPDDLILVPGVIQSTSNYVEHPELVAERLVRFADIVGRERVMAGSDCGFSTFAGDEVVDPEVCFAKLAAMAEGAAIASRRLWRRPGATGI
ncbi:MAG: cobalamin-independent methionine synthase II family protein [Burkholderiales bacterium]